MHYNILGLGTGAAVCTGRNSVPIEQDIIRDRVLYYLRPTTQRMCSEWREEREDAVVWFCSPVMLIHFDDRTIAPSSACAQL